jgi:GNAT superfamily N-acetyltransferase
MTSVDISIAETTQDIAVVQQLCRDFVAWQLAEFPELREKILVYFEPVKWEKTLAQLHVIHARPKGAMLLARSGGMPVGCIMYHELMPDVAEVKRLFVSTEARRGGVAALLVETMLQNAKSDGYQEIRLDTAKFLEGAIKLYGRHGFTEMAQSIELPPEIRDLAVFMQRKL